MSISGVVLEDLTEGKPREFEKAENGAADARFPLHTPAGCELRSLACQDAGEQGLHRFDAFLTDLGAEASSVRVLRHVVPFWVPAAPRNPFAVAALYFVSSW